ncbi:PRD domain-containing protein [Herbiconiux sp. CPCC 203407]|uniref:PRD domain-containing protein n=1 Tax=Herbiconiux oxytropis TaxID=2970915 RepID=A0AA41XJ79_9MICO|nr:PRD domain-containing protein [Herbiconiux oxytropis]MCS5723559.1 PRD domain-containing protein [Herbiconiux oxytropis]MCS5727485.1 PRD domain-containing protein [Herbiconiux oxytropis]
MQTIKKVLNSSVVLAVDENGSELVVLGKGIGYGRKPGEIVAPDDANQVFVSLPDSDQQNLVELLTQIPGEIVEVTRSIVALASAEGLELDPHIYLSLTDHLGFAVERQRKGLVTVNRLAWEVRAIYPRQYAIGVRGVSLLQSRLGVELPEEEGANIAFHLVNADAGNAGVDSLRIVTLVSQVASIVTHSTGVQLHGSDPEGNDLHGARFVAHLQYFARRFFDGKLATSPDDFLFTSLSARYPAAVAAAERVRTLVEQEYGERLPNEEIAFLALHIARVLDA